MAISKKELLVEEYKNCTAVFLNESNLYWTRYGMFLAISSALITVWTYFVNLPHSPLFNAGLFLMALAGLGTAIAWLLVSNKADALSMYWLDRLQKIEQEDSIPFETFGEARHMEFFGKAQYQRKGEISKTAKLPIVLFLIVWVIFLALSVLLVFSILN